jgi:hypothetical protein
VPWSGHPDRGTRSVCEGKPRRGAHLVATGKPAGLCEMAVLTEKPGESIVSNDLGAGAGGNGRLTLRLRFSGFLPPSETIPSSKDWKIPVNRPVGTPDPAAHCRGNLP